jgi:hypothetical protein
MKNYSPQQLTLIENYAIMEEPRIEHYKRMFAQKNKDYRHCSIVLDELNIHPDRLDNFPGHYDFNSDIYFANPCVGQVTTYMVKGIFDGWWFVIQIIFHKSTHQDIIVKQLQRIHEFIVEKFNLIPMIYLGDMFSIMRVFVEDFFLSIILRNMIILCYYLCLRRFVYWYKIDKTLG